MPPRTLNDAGCDVKRADCVALALQCRMIAESLSPANGFLVSASACEQIRSTRIASVSDRGETTLFDYADYQVAGSLETLSGTVKQREDAEKAIQTAHQQGEIYPKNRKRLRNTLAKSE